MGLIKLIINTIPAVKTINNVMSETGASRATIEEAVKDDELDCSFAFSGKNVIKGEIKDEKGYKVIVDNDKYSKFKVWCDNNSRITK